jgi:hypothetical protein
MTAQIGLFDTHLLFLISGNAMAQREVPTQQYAFK